MGIPHVPAQVRRAPLLAIRAVFAGIGRVLMVADRPVAVVVVEEQASRFRSLDQTGNVRLLPAQAPPPAQAAPPAQETVPAQAAPPAREAVPAREGMADLPLPNYDALSLASIRARLRGLDVTQLKVLLDYEAANAERPEFLGMFERRIEKLEAGA
jgi:hypothetical protein